MAYKSFRSGKFGKWQRKNRKVKRGKSRVFPRTRIIRSPGLNAAIKQQISKLSENKVSHVENLSLNIFSTVDAVQFDTNNIIALGCQSGGYSIGQGVKMSERVGNKITIKKATLKGTLVARAYDAVNNPAPKPMQIKMFLFYDKENPNTPPTPAQNADFYDFNNTDSGFRNDLVDLWGAINTDKYRVLKTKTFKIGWAAAPTVASSVANATANLWNNDFKLNANFSIDYTKYLPKTMTFKDGDIDSSSRQLYCMFLACNADGSTIFSGVAHTNVQYQMALQYEDS